MKSLEELEKIREEAWREVDIRCERERTKIVVGMDTCGIAAGARDVLIALLEEVKLQNIKDVVVSQTGCIGVCKLEPMVEVYKPNEEKVTYIEMTPQKIKKVVQDHILNGKIVQEYTINAAK
ncbi:(2Fe-2S) ferredoxin domain-containing protein [Inediibacterium massiliense]|uniref:(2Fe-2S) ferredoxin domain-containing protein n=1 Tax=Inediibacterium massiliense TaxID=1658111 RepID=UPI0006B622A0|nr:(2Fe-2S) ferredoxin domain-containing protein [Inediibacterium massiliense]